MNRYVQQFCKPTLSETQITSYTDYYTLISQVIGKQSKLSAIGSGKALGNCIASDNKSQDTISNSWSSYQSYLQTVVGKQ